ITDMAKVTIRYWASAKDAAGMAEESVDAVTLRDALDVVIVGRQPDTRLANVIARSSFLVNADQVGKTAKESIVLGEGAVIEVLPPFAGG
ncbi:MAG: MoaD/ThiS family protein, partial [Trebonia sp.]